MRFSKPQFTFGRLVLLILAQGLAPISLVAAAQVEVEIVKDFVYYGIIQQAPLILADDGLLYSTEPYGGAFHGGTVYRTDTNGNITVIHSFQCGVVTNGCSPAAGLIQLGDGFLYGTTDQGGANSQGTVFKIKPDGTNFAVIKSFSCTVATDACRSQASLIQSSDGFLYGTTSGADSGSQGTVFKLKPDGTNFAVIKSFQCIEGCVPLAGLISLPDGFLYGTTSQGGATNSGTVFKLLPDGSNFSVIKSFQCNVAGDGCAPAARLIQLADGFLYGTTRAGGANGGGAVYKLRPDGTGFNVIQSFVCGFNVANCDGGGSYAGLIQLSDGFLYGTTYQGGATNSGTVFKVKPDGTGFSVIKSFECNVITDGCFPMTELIHLSDGFLYGTALGGITNSGIFYKVTPEGTGFTLLASFGCVSSCSPSAGLIQASDDFLYGTTQGGGVGNGGSVFKVKPDGTGFSVIKSFNCIGSTDACSPLAGLIQLSDGFLYGTTAQGGATNSGTVFKVKPDGTGFSVIKSFDCLVANDGCNPFFAGLIQLSDGFLYGTTAGTNDGTVFKLKPDGTSFSVIKSFHCGNADGCSPLAGLIQLSDGFLYGTTDFGNGNNLGTVFKLKPDGTGFSVIKAFQCGVATDGCRPQASLIQSTDGFLYGTTERGGGSDGGTVFKVKPDGTGFSVIKSFQCGVGTQGCRPVAGLIQLADGFLYGTTQGGGADNNGTVFKVLPDGNAFTVLNSFVFDGDDGIQPMAGLTLANNGYVYGTTFSGGAFGVGTIFRFVAPDTTAPDTSINSGPTGVIAVNSATFSWTGSDNVTVPANLVYAYRLDPIEPVFSAFGSTTSQSYTGLTNGNYTFIVKAKDENGNEDTTPATRTFAVSVPSSNPTIALTFGGQTADRVGQAEFALNADGKLDGVFSVTLNTGSGNRTITRLHLTNTPGGVWNTVGGDGFWSLGVATSTGSALLNASNDSVNFGVTEGDTFKIFAADYLDAMFLNGVVFTLTASFSDGSSASASATISVAADTTPPDTSITNGPPNPTAVSVATFNWTGSDNVTAAQNLIYAYRLDPIEPNFSAFTSATTKSYTGLANGNYTFIVKARDQAGNEDPSPASRVFAVDVPATNLTMTLVFDGQLRDRVGPGEFALSGDGASDGVFTVSLMTGSGNRVVNGLSLVRNGPIGVWDTTPNDNYWVLGAASGLDMTLYNGNDGRVNFAVSDGGSFKIFASDYLGSMFVPGASFVLTANFTDGSTASASTTINVVMLPTVTIAATSPNAAEGGASAQFLVTRTGSTAAALTVNYTVSGTATIGADYQTLVGNVVIPANVSMAPIMIIPIDDNLVEGNETVILSLAANAAYILGSPSSAMVTIQDNDSPSAGVSLTYNTALRDRVRQSNQSQVPDGNLDPTFTVTFPAGGATRTVASLRLDSSDGGIWDTAAGTPYWTLGAASGLDSPLYNGANDAVSFAVAPGDSFNIFASDWFFDTTTFPHGLFHAGALFTLTIGFSDGSTATAQTTIGAPAPAATMALR